MTNCNGCIRLFHISINDKPPQLNNNIYLDSKWERICDYTPYGVRRFKNCPCSECLIKSVCNAMCDSLRYIILERNKTNYYRNINHLQEEI